MSPSAIIPMISSMKENFEVNLVSQARNVIERMLREVSGIKMLLLDTKTVIHSSHRSVHIGRDN